MVTAGQCWYWFDGPRAAAEARRLLKPGGTLVMAHFDWLPLTGNMVAATERLIERHNPQWQMGGWHAIHTNGMTAAAEAGFHGIECFSFDVAAVYSHSAWRGRIWAGAGVGASLAPTAVNAFDADLARLLAKRLPRRPPGRPPPLLRRHQPRAVISLIGV
ncbi:MAG: hypothetical protein VCB77_01615 [Alphaproteobacteria bacterium]